jgi:hypothetical protein
MACASSRRTFGASACARCRPPAFLEATNRHRAPQVRMSQASAASAGFAGLPLFAELYHGWDRAAPRAAPQRAAEAVHADDGAGALRSGDRGRSETPEKRTASSTPLLCRSRVLSRQSMRKVHPAITRSQIFLVEAQSEPGAARAAVRALRSTGISAWRQRLRRATGGRRFTGGGRPSAGGGGPPASGGRPSTGRGGTRAADGTPSAGGGRTRAGGGTPSTPGGGTRTAGGTPPADGRRRTAAAGAR